MFCLDIWKYFDVLIKIKFFWVLEDNDLYILPKYSYYFIKTIVIIKI